MSPYLIFPKPLTLETLEFHMILVQGGTYSRGDSEALRAKPEHKVKVNSFEILRFQVTQKLWYEVVGYNPSTVISDQRPVESVSWNDCQDFFRKLNRKTRKKYRFPTEAEWEYAARAGRNANWGYAGGPNVKEVAVFRGNSLSISNPVGYKLPNELGIYDMSGNMDEWCADIYTEYKETQNQALLEVKTFKNSTEELRSMRVGGYNDKIIGCHVASRDKDKPSNRYDYVSFRIARSLA